MKKIINYLIGEYFCRFFHKPLFWSLPTVDRKGSRYGWSCAYCNRYWDSYRTPKIMILGIKNEK